MKISTGHATDTQRTSVVRGQVAEIREKMEHRTSAGQRPDTDTTKPSGPDTRTYSNVRCPVRPVHDDGIFETGKNNLQILDRIAFEMEVAWGVDALPLMVSDELRAKFERQGELLNQAIDAGDQERIERVAAAMARAWHVLDADARAQGRKPARECVFVGKHPSDQFVCVYTSAASLGDLPEGVPRFHIDELVKFIPPLVLRAKDAFPGSIIDDVRQKEELDDEIPF